jgi:hypothetical protein
MNSSFSLFSDLVEACLVGTLWLLCFCSCGQIAYWEPLFYGSFCCFSVLWQLPGWIPLLNCPVSVWLSWILWIILCFVVQLALEDFPYLENCLCVSVLWGAVCSRWVSSGLRCILTFEGISVLRISLLSSWTWKKRPVLGIISLCCGFFEEQFV